MELVVMIVTIAAALYSAGFILTLLYLFKVLRGGFIRRLIQIAAALVWPAYWLIIHGPRVSLIMALRIVSFVVLSCVLVLLIPFVILERRQLIS
jgi:hypothetical protein